MSSHPDIVIHSSDGKLQFVVEIKSISNTDSTWATHYRRNLLLHQVIPISPYFLLVAADRMYLWTDSASMPTAAPSVEGDTKAVLARYLPTQHGSFSPSGLEMASQLWLGELTAFPNSSHRNADEKRLIEDTGLLNKIQTGSLTLEAHQ